MDPIVPQSRTYKRTDDGAAGRVCPRTEAMTTMVIAAAIKSENFVVRMRERILHR